MAIDFEADRVVEYLDRFKGQRVSAPYAAQLSTAILRQRPMNYFAKNSFVRRMIAILTMLNSPEPIDKASLLAKLMRSRPEHIREWLRMKGVESPDTLSSDAELVSGKTEYFIMSRLLQGVIPLKQQSPSPLRKQIFNAVKTINLTSLQSSTLGDDDVLGKLYTLTYCDLYWAKIDFIFKHINKGRRELVSIPAIEAELAVLKKLGFIARKKFKDRDDYGYYILTLTIDEGLRFPAVDELFGTCPEDQRMEVMDPLTGIVEKI